jgi:hypothetical protein
MPRRPIAPEHVDPRRSTRAPNRPVPQHRERVPTARNRRLLGLSAAPGA